MSTCWRMALQPLLGRTEDRPAGTPKPKPEAAVAEEAAEELLGCKLKLSGAAAEDELTLGPEANPVPNIMSHIVQVYFELIVQECVKTHVRQRSCTFKILDSHVVRQRQPACSVC